MWRPPLVPDVYAAHIETSGKVITFDRPRIQHARIVSPSDLENIVGHNVFDLLDKRAAGHYRNAIKLIKRRDHPLFFYSSVSFAGVTYKVHRMLFSVDKNSFMSIGKYCL